MSDVTISSMIGDIEKYKFNPVMIQRIALEALRIASNNSINIVDPTNPFVFCLENTATNTAAFMQQNEASTRRLYPSSALIEEDLYLHMSDKEYIGRFALPASANFTIMLSKKELLTRLLLEVSTGMKKITIPRNTEFTIANTVFSMQYPVDIRLLSHGGLQIIYDNSVLSPLSTLTTNVVEWDEVYDPNDDAYIRLTVQAQQFNIITSYNDISAASGFKTEIDISDQFYHVRCYIQDSLGVYNEIQTTHTQQIYDPYVPTAVITLLDKKVKVTIPIIYISTKQISGKLRIDVYQTKGELDMILSNQSLEDFGANWINVDKSYDTIYTTAIRNFKTIAIYSTDHVLGGRAAIGFTDLRTRVIKNAIGSFNLPITNIQLQTTLEDAGYEVVRNIDTITNRVYLATRNLPKPADERIITAASASMANVTLTLFDAISCFGVIDNGESVTLTPNTLYQNNNGVIKPVKISDYNAIEALTLSEKCTKITNGNYLYSPFHYVLDSSDKTFEVRPYYLDSPVIESKSFVKENIATGMQVSIDSNYTITKINTGFKLTITTKSTDNYKTLPNASVNVQLAFNYKNEQEKSYLLGTQIGIDQTTNERIFNFYIDSNFDIDAYDYLTVNSFKYSNTSITVKSLLLQEMDVYFTVTTPNGIANEINDELGFFQLPIDSIGITHEKLKIRFGFALKNLWVRSKSNVDSVPYQTYDHDIIAIYPEDIYERDPSTGSIFKMDSNGNIVLDPDGKPLYNLIHRKGEIMLDENGNILYSNNTNDVIYDKEGQPIPIVNYQQKLIRSIDILMLEAAYYFATDSIVTAYTKSIIDSIVNWITVDLIRFNSTLLDQTKIYFFPKVTLGDIRVITLNGVEVTIPASNNIKVKLHVSTLTYNNTSLIESLTRTTIKTIDTALRNTVISLSAIEYALIDAYGKDVINVEVNGVGGPVNYKAFTIIDKSNNCSIKKRLALLPDNKMRVEEDIDITYINHGIVG